MISPRHTITVVAPNWIGDAVMSLPAIGDLAAEPDIGLAIVATPYTGRIYWGLPGVRRIALLPRGGLRATWRRGRYLRRWESEAIALFPPSLSSAIAAKVSRCGIRAGLATDTRGWLLTQKVPKAGHRNIHLADTYRRIVRLAAEAMDLDVGACATPRIAVDDGDRASLRARFDADDYAVIVPGAAFGPAKRWPLARYRELVLRLSEKRMVIIGGAPSDFAAGETLVAGVPNACNLAGKTSLGEFLALLDGASAVVANDSGAPHISGNLGVPTFVLFGSTSPAWTAPQGSRVTVIQHEVHCNPCYRRTCPYQLECFHGISVDAVYAAVERELSNGVAA